MTNFARPLLTFCCLAAFFAMEKVQFAHQTCCCSYATLFIPRALISKQFKKLYLLLPVSKPEEHY